MRTPVDKVCKNCGARFSTSESRQVFCSRSCSSLYNNPRRENMSNEQKDKLSRSLKAFYASDTYKEKLNDPNYRSKKMGKEHVLRVAETTRGKYRAVCPDSLLELSKRTVMKIFKRLGVACSRCGWGDAACDVHHIMGKSIDNPNRHGNLAYLCPNCHRLAHSGKIKPEELTPLAEHIGDRWKEYYYG